MKCLKMLRILRINIICLEVHFSLLQLKSIYLFTEMTTLLKN